MVAYSLHFHCVLNYPYFPWCCVFSTLSHVWRIILTFSSLVLRFLYTLSPVVWITHTSPSVVYSLLFTYVVIYHGGRTIYAYCPCVVVCSYFLSPVFWITHTSPVLHILYNFTFVLNCPYFPWCCLFSTLSPVFWITLNSPVVAYSLHIHLCLELPIIPLVLRILYTFTCILNYP